MVNRSTAGEGGRECGRELDELIDGDVATALDGVAGGGEQSLRAATASGATVVVQLSRTGLQVCATPTRRPRDGRAGSCCW
jgi:hypothetical protein